MSRTQVDPGYFFQTNDSIAERDRKQKKSKNKRGDPIKLDSKLLAVVQTGPALVCVAEAGGQVRAVDVTTGKEIAKYIGPSAPLTSLAVWRGTHTLFAGCWDKTIHSWNIITRKPGRRYVGHTDFIKCVETGIIDGVPVLFSGSADASIIVWNIETGDKMHVIRGHTRAVLDIRSDPTSFEKYDYKEMVIVSTDSTKHVKRWRISKTSLVEEGDALTHHETSVNRVCFDAMTGNDDMDVGFWTASDDKTAKHVDRHRDWECDTTLQHPDFVRDIIVDQTGQYVVTACRDENVRLWDPHTGDLVATFDGHFEEVTGLTIVTIDGDRYVISISIDGTIRKWSLAPSAISDFCANSDARTETGDGHDEDEEEEKPKPSENALTAEEEAELAAMMDDD